MKKFPFLTITAAVLIVSCFAAIGCDMCANEIVREIPSPKRDYKIVIFQRNCGATSGFSTQLSVIKIDGKLPKESGNLFIADTDHGNAPAATWGGPEVEVVWENSDSIVIRYNSKARIFKKETRIHQINVKYLQEL